jgi:hypothetical protein
MTKKDDPKPTSQAQSGPAISQRKKLAMGMSVNTGAGSGTGVKAKP